MLRHARKTGDARKDALLTDVGEDKVQRGVSRRKLVPYNLPISFSRDIFPGSIC